MADRPVKELGDRTPLEAAKTPNLDALAKKGALGMQNALAQGEYPTSEEAHLAIFGYDYKEDLPGRGVLEALGLDIPITKKDLVLRVDFGTVNESLRVLDPRAGNIKSVKSFCEQLPEKEINGLKFKVYSGLAHRGVLVISGAPVSREIKHHSTVVTDTDPHKSKVHMGGNKVLMPEPIDDSVEAKITAEALWEYLLWSHKILNNYVENKVRKREGKMPANFILTRGAGFIKPITPFDEKYHLKGLCVAGAPLYKGIGKYLGLDVAEVRGATGGIDTDVEEKVRVLLEGLSRGYDFGFLHLKGADVVAEEDGDWEAKKNFFEKADVAFGPLLNFDGVVAVTGDHSTPCVLKDHCTDPVPILITGSVKDSVSSFGEREAAKGAIGHLTGPEIMPKLIEEAKSV